MDPSKRAPLNDWADQDLLTKDEARERLVHEIARAQAELDDVKSHPTPDTTAVTLLERRLSAMRSICGEYASYLDSGLDDHTS